MRIRCCLLLVVFAVSASAQRVHESITVDVVEVPVHVVRRGKAVTGLTRDMFELYVNGKRHPFEYFDVIDSRAEREQLTPEARAQAEEVAATLDRRNLTVLLFDTAATSPLYLGRASAAAQEFVAEASPRETFAVARLDPSGVRFLVPFTNDRLAVIRACRTLRPSRAGDALGLATTDSERAELTGSAAPGGMLSLGDVALDDIGPGMANTTPQAQAAAEALQDKVSEALRADSEIRTAKHLGQLAERLAPIDGVKHVILFAEGSRRAANPTSAGEMHDKFHAAGVILDAVEVDTLVPGWIDASRRASSSLWASPASQYVPDPSEPLYTLALGTGGVVAKHSNVIDGLRFLREIQGVTYILGFRPPQTGRLENDITVKVKKQPVGTDVTYRRGYSTTGAAKRDEGLLLADVMVNDIPQRGLTVDLAVDPVTSGAKVVVRVPGKELLARESDGPRTPIDLFLYVFNEQNHVTAWSYLKLTVDLEKGREFLSANPYRIERAFTLPPGKFSAKALIRVPNSDITGFQRADFVVAAK